jgi:hypothetical protein
LLFLSFYRFIEDEPSSRIEGSHLKWSLMEKDSVEKPKRHPRAPFKQNYLMLAFIFSG